VTSLLRWAAKQRLTANITVPRISRPPTYRCLDETERRVMIDQLANDAELDLRDRVAGLLVLLYGRPVTRISRLQVVQVTTNEHGTLLALAGAPVVIVEPLGSLLADLAAKPRGRAVTATSASKWLFPGKVVGQHIERLCNRLRRLGITSVAARTSALLPLAQDVPAPILAETLGMSEEQAAHWAKAAGADYARYVANRTRNLATS
jgi:hypothetical protein